MSKGRALKLFDFDDKSMLRLNMDNAETVLTAVGDLPVLVLSVAGAFRGGKSFLLNIIIHFLEKEGKTGWFEDPDAMLSGFPSKKSMETVTTGIDIWSQPFFLRNTEGEQIAVILMDTQGTNDNRISKGQFTRIFAMSTLLSDIQINNVRNTIGRDQLEQLQYFLEFGRHAVGCEETLRRLVMLVRDWQCTNHFGFEEGHKYWTEQVMKKTDASSMAVELQQTLKTFMEVTCVLLPSPGDRMLRIEEFQGPVSELNNEFRENVVKLVEWLLIADLKPERTGAELIEWCQRMSDVFQGTDLPEPRSLIAMQAERMYFKTQQESLDMFDKDMRDKMNAMPYGFMGHEEFNMLCTDTFTASLDHYDRRRRGFEDEDIRQSTRKGLCQRLEEAAADFRSRNGEKLKSHNHKAMHECVEFYEKSMKECCQSLLEEEDFQRNHENALSMTLVKYNDLTVDPLFILEQEMREIITGKVLILFELENRRRLNERNVGMALKHYTEAMKETCQGALKEEDFQAESDRNMNQAIVIFNDLAKGLAKEREEWQLRLKVMILERGKIYQENNHRALMVQNTFLHEEEQARLLHEEEIKRIAMEKAFTEERRQAELRRLQEEFETQRNQQKMAYDEEIKRKRIESEKEAEKKIHDFELKRLKEEQEKATLLAKQHQAQLEEARQKSLKQQEELELKMEQLRLQIRQATVAAAQKSKKKGICSVQ